MKGESFVIALVVLAVVVGGVMYFRKKAQQPERKVPYIPPVNSTSGTTGVRASLGDLEDAGVKALTNWINQKI